MIKDFTMRKLNTIPRYFTLLALMAILVFVFAKFEGRDAYSSDSIREQTLRFTEAFKIINEQYVEEPDREQITLSLIHI